MREELNDSRLGHAELERDPVDDGTWRRLAPLRIPAERLCALIIMTLLFIPCALGGGAMWWFSDWSFPLKLGISLGVGLLLVLTGALLYWWPKLEHRHTIWCLDDEGFEIRKGVIFRHMISVPRRRIQHTDVAQGPVQRRYHLGTLVMHTAGTHSFEIRLEGISHEMALRVRDFLLIRPAIELGPSPIDTLLDGIPAGEDGA